MNYLKISLGIFLALAASRFIPHPPNFTSLLALSFYVPALLGVRFIPSLVIGFIFTDIIVRLLFGPNCQYALSLCANKIVGIKIAIISRN